MKPRFVCHLCWLRDKRIHRRCIWFFKVEKERRGFQVKCTAWKAQRDKNAHVALSSVVEQRINGQEESFKHSHGRLWASLCCLEVTKIRKIKWPHLSYGTLHLTIVGGMDFCGYEQQWILWDTEQNMCVCVCVWERERERERETEIWTFYWREKTYSFHQSSQHKRNNNNKLKY